MATLGVALIGNALVSAAYPQNDLQWNVCERGFENPRGRILEATTHVGEALARHQVGLVEDDHVSRCELATRELEHRRADIVDRGGIHERDHAVHAREVPEGRIAEG